jgi:hypothetical protein
MQLGINQKFYGNVEALDDEEDINDDADNQVTDNS